MRVTVKQGLTVVMLKLIMFTVVEFPPEMKIVSSILILVGGWTITNYSS